jgi:hypothetical protein
VKVLLRCCVWVLAIVHMAGCNGNIHVEATDGEAPDGGAPACGPGPCGGDLVGTWDIVTSCLRFDDTVTTFDGCPSVRFHIDGDVVVTGTSTFAADLTFTETTSVSGGGTMVTPVSCLPIGRTCEDMGAETVGAGCSSTFALGNTPVTATGTYATSAGLLTLLATSSTTADLSDFCVKGTTLTETHRPDMGSIVFTRR